MRCQTLSEITKSIRQNLAAHILLQCNLTISTLLIPLEIECLSFFSVPFKKFLNNFLNDYLKTNCPSATSTEIGLSVESLPAKISFERSLSR